MSPSREFHEDNTPEEVRLDAMWKEVVQKDGNYPVEVKLSGREKPIRGLLRPDLLVKGDFRLEFPVKSRKYQDYAVVNAEATNWNGDAGDAWEALHYKMHEKIGDVHFGTTGIGNDEFYLHVDRYQTGEIPGWRKSPYLMSFSDKEFDRSARGAAKILHDQLGGEVVPSQLPVKADEAGSLKSGR